MLGRKAFLSLLAAAVACGCAGPSLTCPQLRWSGARRDTGLILIVNDTMRRDRMGTYGGPARTPTFDALARQEVLFDRAYTQAPWTKPSIATLYTSLFPSQHGVLTHPKDTEDVEAPLGRTDVLDASLTTLAEALRSAGFRTAAFVGNPWLRKGLGFEQGFEVYDDSFAAWEAPGDRIGDAALEWLAHVPVGERFFLYLHFMESHRPYSLLKRSDLERHGRELLTDSRPLSAAGSDLVAKLVWLEEGIPAVQAGVPPTVSLLELSYDRGIEEFDQVLERFLSRLRQREAWPETAVVVTSDHGEALFARGYDNHGNGLYDDEVAIPLVARLPGVVASAARCSCPVGLIDLAPTLCDYLGVEPPRPSYGRSLLAAAARRGRPGSEEALVVTEGVMSKPSHRAIRNETHKLLWQPDGGPEGKLAALFDISRDPEERRDLLEPRNRSEATRKILQSLASRVAHAVPAFRAPEPTLVPLDPEMERRLRSLGYL